MYVCIMLLNVEMKCIFHRCWETILHVKISATNLDISTKFDFEKKEKKLSSCPFFFIFLQTSTSNFVIQPVINICPPLAVILHGPWINDMYCSQHKLLLIFLGIIKFFIDISASLQLYLYTCIRRAQFFVEQIFIF